MEHEQGKPMFYVYHLRSLPFPNRVYTGFTEDLRSRLRHHNDGCCDFTRPFRPWSLSSIGGLAEPGVPSCAP